MYILRHASLRPHTSASRAPRQLRSEANHTLLAAPNFADVNRPGTSHHREIRVRDEKGENLKLVRKIMKASIYLSRTGYGAGGTVFKGESNGVRAFGVLLFINSHPFEFPTFHRLIGACVREHTVRVSCATMRGPARR